MIYCVTLPVSPLIISRYLPYFSCFLVYIYSTFLGFLLLSLGLIFVTWLHAACPGRNSNLCLQTRSEGRQALGRGGREHREKRTLKKKKLLVFFRVAISRLWAINLPVISRGSHDYLKGHICHIDRDFEYFGTANLCRAILPFQYCIQF